MAILPEVFVNLARELMTVKAKGGRCEEVYQRGMALTGLSRATLFKKLKPYLPRHGRKPRSDKGKNQLAIQELQVISAAWLYVRRNQLNKKCCP